MKLENANKMNNRELVSLLSLRLYEKKREKKLKKLKRENAKEIPIFN